MTSEFRARGAAREATIAAGFGSAFVEFAVARGASAQALLASAGLRDADLTDADGRLPLTRYVALLEAGAEQCSDRALALKFGEAVRLEDISIVGLIGMAAPTMGEGREQLNRFARLMIDAEGVAPEMLQLVRDEDGVWLELTSSIFSAHPVLTEAAFARFVCGVTRSGRRFPNAVHFTFSQPPHRAAYDRIFKVPLVFGSRRNALLIDEAFLAIKLPPPNRYVFGVLSQRAEALLASLSASHTMRARVESALMPILHTGDFSMAAVAKKLGLSQSTLYRQLRSEGVRYDDVLDELRRTLALHFLDAKRVSVNEAAYLVGFSESSAFSRAFKRWTGKAPSDHVRRDR
jgi:AraC-like DNA-binding protein